MVSLLNVDFSVKYILYSIVGESERIFFLACEKSNIFHVATV